MMPPARRWRSPRMGGRWSLVLIVSDGWRSLVEPLASAGMRDGRRMSRTGGGGEEVALVVVEDEVREPSGCHGVAVDVGDGHDRVD